MAEGYIDENGLVRWSGEHDPASVDEEEDFAGETDGDEEEDEDEQEEEDEDA